MNAGQIIGGSLVAIGLITLVALMVDDLGLAQALLVLGLFGLFAVGFVLLIAFG